MVLVILCMFFSQGYEGSLLKVTSKNGKTASVSNLNINLHCIVGAVCFSNVTRTMAIGRKKSVLE